MLEDGGGGDIMLPAGPFLLREHARASRARSDRLVITPARHFGESGEIKCAGVTDDPGERGDNEGSHRFTDGMMLAVWSQIECMCVCVRARVCVHVWRGASSQSEVGTAKAEQSRSCSPPDSAFGSRAPARAGQREPS